MKNLLLTLLVFALILSACIAAAQDTSINKTQNAMKTTGKVHVKTVSFTLTQTDNTPDEMYKFDAYIKKHLKQIPGVNGNVMVNFVVEKDGSISNIKIEKGLTKAADEEALRVVKLYPHWEPDTLDGDPMKAPMTVPIIFGKVKHNIESPK